MTEKEQKIFDIQQPSTKKALPRPKEQDEKHFWRPLPDTWVANPNAKTEEERVNARNLSYEEASIATYNRYHAGERLAAQRKETNATSITIKKRNKAIEAFIGFIEEGLPKIKFKDLMMSMGLGPKEKWESGPDDAK